MGQRCCTIILQWAKHGVDDCSSGAIADQVAADIIGQIDARPTSRIADQVIAERFKRP
jgi:hypothetical protein